MPVMVLIFVLVAAGALVFYFSWRRGQTIRRLLNPSVLFSFGGKEVFREISGLAVAPDGRLLVTDRLDHNIKIFSPAGELLDTIGGYGVGEANLWLPIGLAYAAGRVATFDSGNGYVKVFTLEGDLALKHPVYSRFSLPRDLALSESGVVVVADTGNHRLVVIPPVGSTLRDIGRRGTGVGHFSDPFSLTFVGSDRLAVADVGNHRITIVTLGGEVVTTWSYRGNGEAYSLTPSVTYLADRGLVLMTDRHHHRLQVFNPSGKWVGEIGRRPDGREIFGAGPLLAAASRPGEVVVVTEKSEIFILKY